MAFTSKCISRQVAFFVGVLFRFHRKCRKILDCSLIDKPTGRDDFLIKDANGDLEAWMNIGIPNDDSIITWVPSRKVTNGFKTANFALADINGDGAYLKRTNDYIFLMLRFAL